MSLRYRLVPLVASAALLAGCGGANAPAAGSGANVVENDTTEEATPEAPEEDAAAETTDGPAVEETATEDATEDATEMGTRENPLPLGTVITMGDWEVTVTDVMLNANDAVAAENEFNEPPVDGRQFVMFGVDATYKGTESGNPWLDFSWGIVGSGGNTFSGGGTDDYCGVIPDDLMEEGEAFPDASVTGNICYSVPSDQVEGSTIRVEDTFSFTNESRACFATS